VPIAESPLQHGGLARALTYPSREYFNSLLVDKELQHLLHDAQHALYKPGDENLPFDGFENNEKCETLRVRVWLNHLSSLSIKNSTKTFTAFNHPALALYSQVDLFFSKRI
jgi:hypothetical protein